MDSHIIMKIDALTVVKTKPYFQAISAIFLSISLLSACQKTSESETDNEMPPEVAVQSTPVTSNINTPTVTDEAGNTAERLAQNKM